jgi:hypothetical protein
MVQITDLAPSFCAQQAFSQCNHGNSKTCHFVGQIMAHPFQHAPCMMSTLFTAQGGAAMKEGLNQPVYDTKNIPSLLARIPALVFTLLSGDLSALWLKPFDLVASISAFFQILALLPAVMISLNKFCKLSELTPPPSSSHGTISFFNSATGIDAAILGGRQTEVA